MEYSIAHEWSEYNHVPKCNRADGSAYETPKMKRAQILEKVKKIPVNVTICMVQFRVNLPHGVLHENGTNMSYGVLKSLIF